MFAATPHDKISAVPSQVWSIVLAAGAGRRLAGLTGGLPKQFFRPAAGASLLEMTLSRLAPLAPPARTVIIVDESHRQPLSACRVPGDATVLYQPSDRGTATGVLMALTPVLAHGTDDVVILTPSDHAVADTDAFRRGVLQAIELARVENAVTLFGVRPTDALADYGWIIPDRDDVPVGRVSTFVEKPPPEVALDLHAQGAVWNTMVVVARASALRALYEAHLPELTEVFDMALTLDGPARQRFLVEMYPTLPRVDFSRDLLEQARTLFVYTWPEAIGWSDLGTPERLNGWLGVGAA